MSTEMRNAIDMALRSSVTYIKANDMARDGFLVARVNSCASTSDVDIRIHWNWFIHGWNAAHIWFATIAREGSH